MKLTDCFSKQCVLKERRLYPFIKGFTLQGSGSLIAEDAFLVGIPPAQLDNHWLVDLAVSGSRPTI